MNRAFGEDNTKYANTSVAEMVEERQQEKGVQIRSVQYAIERIKDDPEFAKYAVFKPGPLNVLVKLFCNAFDRLLPTFLAPAAILDI